MVRRENETSRHETSRHEATQHDQEQHPTLRRPVLALGSFGVWPWLVVLVFTGCFHFYRGAPIDGVVYVLVALALGLDASGVFPVVRRRRARPRYPVMLVFAALACGIVLVVAPRHSVADGIVVAAIGATVVTIAWPDPPSARLEPASTTETQMLRRTAVLWASVAILGCLWELSAFFLGQSSPTAEYEFPPLSTLVGPLLDEPVGRAVLVGLWLLGGFALLRRGGRR